MGKRISLAELEQLEQEDLDTAGPTPTSVRVDNSQKNTETAPQERSDFIKVCITVPPSMFDQLEDLSRLKRKQGKPYTKSALIRDALKVWFTSMKT